MLLKSQKIRPPQIFFKKNALDFIRLNAYFVREQSTKKGHSEMPDSYKEFRSVITNLLRLRGATKEMTLEELEICLNKFEQVVEARREEAAEFEKEEQEKQAKIEALRQQIEEAGISPDEILGTKKKTASNRSKLPKKYVITDEDGNEVRWSGVGLAPKPFKKAMDQGKDKSDFLDPQYAEG